MLRTTLIVSVLTALILQACTKPYKSEPVSRFPALEPVGRFYEFERAVLNANYTSIADMFSDSLFVFSQQRFLKKYEKAVDVSKTLRDIFRRNIIEPTSSDFIYKYNPSGSLQEAKAYTCFLATLAKRENPEEIQKQTALTLRKNPQEYQLIQPEKRNLKIVWTLEKNSWKIESIVVDGKSILEVVSFSTVK